MTLATMTHVPVALRLPWGNLLLLAAFGLALAIYNVPAELAAGARAALAVTVLAMAGWAHPRLPDTLVALAAGLALVLAGVVPEAQLFAMLGSELIWLLLAAFVIAAVIRDSGLALRLAAPVFALRLPFAGLVMVLTGLIAATALVVPSTSGRAALLLPVCLALTAVLPDPRLVRALALLFPTVILLSAGGSIVGAGAHLLAVEAIAGSGGPRLGYVDWLLIGGPLALIASLCAAGLILMLFVPRQLWRVRVAPPAPEGTMTQQERRIAGVVMVLVMLWMTEGIHGIGMAVVALGGALVLLTPPFGHRKPKEVFRTIDLDLILFMAMAALVAAALMSTGADRWLAGAILAALPIGPALPSWLVVGGLAIVAVLSHLAIASRSARAAVLIPAVALPAAALGLDPALLVLVAVMGTGFCQTLMASAKPVAIFGQAEGAGFTPADLLRLALPLAPVMVVLVTVFALTLWPRQLATLIDGAVMAAPDALPHATIAVPAVTEPPAAAAPTGAQRAALAGLAGYVAAPSPMAQANHRLQVRSGPDPDAQTLSRIVVQAPPPQSTPAPAPVRVTTPQRQTGRFEADLRAAEAQIRRDLRQLERQFTGIFR